MKRFVTLSVLLMMLCGCTTTSLERKYDKTAESLISWMDIIMFNDVKYQGEQTISVDDNVEVKLGEIYGIIDFKVADVVHDPSYQIVNGDSTFHDIGTEVYEIKGYSTEFRLGIKNEENSIRIYEAFENAKAKSGIDILDIMGKVQYISLNSEIDGKTELGTIEDKEKVDYIINEIMESDLEYILELDYSYRYFIEFHLNDGTSVTRNFLPRNNLISPGVLINEEIKDIILQCLD